MSERITRLRMRGGTAAEWTAANPVLLSREFGIETDTRRLKMGDGTTAWASLPYFLAGADVRGQVSRLTSYQIPSAAQGVYRAIGATGTLDTATTSGLTLGTTDPMGLRNSNGNTVLLRVSGSVEATAGNNNTLALKLAVNGVVIDATETRSVHASGGQDAKLTTTWMVSLPANGEVSMQLANLSASADIIVTRARLVASQVQL